MFRKTIAVVEETQVSDLTKSLKAVPDVLLARECKPIPLFASVLCFTEYENDPHSVGRAFLDWRIVDLGDVQDCEVSLIVLLSPDIELSKALLDKLGATFYVACSDENRSCCDKIKGLTFLGSTGKNFILHIFQKV